MMEQTKLWDKQAIILATTLQPEHTLSESKTTQERGQDFREYISTALETKLKSPASINGERENGLQCTGHLMVALI